MEQGVALDQQENQQRRQQQQEDSLRHQLAMQVHSHSYAYAYYCHLDTRVSMLGKLSTDELQISRSRYIYT